MNIKNLNGKLEEIENNIDNLDVNELEEKVYNLEKDVLEELEICLPNQEQSLRKILKKIKKLKEENDFYDQESELDRMFPNRNDDDFDDDSM